MFIRVLMNLIPLFISKNKIQITLLNKSLIFKFYFSKNLFLFFFKFYSPEGFPCTLVFKYLIFLSFKGNFQLLFFIDFFKYQII
jgi:hypothetical protein